MTPVFRFSLLDSCLEQRHPTLGQPATTTNSYLKFDLSTLRSGVTGGQVSKATLTLYVNRVYAPGTLDVLAVMDPWDEKSIQVSNAHFSLSPDDAVRGVAVGADAEGHFISVDVTAIVRSWLDGRAPNYGLALTDGSLGTDLRFDSKENASTSHEPRPELTLVGLPGPQGPLGPQGPAGPKGDKGDSGDAANTEVLEARISALQKVLELRA